MRSFSVIAVVVGAISFAPLVASKCCYTWEASWYSGLCKDNQAPPQSGCCGRGACNIFCCNCDDGCRAATDSDNPRLSHGNSTSSSNSRRSDSDDIDTECSDKFAAADTNGDGMLDFDEWLGMKAGGNHNKARQSLASHWAKYDHEDKGYLTKEEAYSRRATSS